MERQQARQMSRKNPVHSLKDLQCSSSTLSHAKSRTAAFLEGNRQCGQLDTQDARPCKAVQISRDFPRALSIQTCIHLHVFAAQKLANLATARL